ncbi:1-acyl-sn-glycerol-3-phosphate acyltransferase [Nocardioidaceae bacterium]|nr:1-acyl-sn-glycerol-3-phosphate acyltransferase [Nocardioidaceae bacterium]
MRILRRLLPPKRLVLVPVVLASTAAVWTLLPLWLIAAALVSPGVPGTWRPLRLLWLTVLHLTVETIVLVELLGLWIASGFGLFLRRPWFEATHYEIARTYLRLFHREARRVLHLEIDVQGPTPDAWPGTPLIVCCRHAGPADSFVLLYALMQWFAREPRLVLKDTIAWEPMVGTLLHRIPSRFVEPHPERGEDLLSQIADLARDLDHDDVFVIFPEGGNYTPQRRARAIEKLREIGRDDMAGRAEGMEHVLAPRPGGLCAALGAAPQTDVMFVAHTGLDHVYGVRDMWRELPMDKRITMRWWRVPHTEIPDTEEEQVDWLFTWWAVIDDWVDEHRPEDLAASG